ncbi:MAG TPA: peptide-methionine (S)-S-oxide reductase [Algoriphagus sp.]|jgi:peptide-methionine (S)-S-oxide reductase|uniref:peptide-methionine (S)-S-oxide reductase MsrA n=1 Tax=unclassified Algoriphagus TaxID=2641541 RepID=UPI000C65D5B9|nr:MULTISPECIES: peptide-methionine (S)-S-oxide reductase MsrA [unclassified Algoriphagus]MAL12720.1 peptide-methionine (S)-S-oxide reductase [Algoriphagus sp.]QYH38497.1 peptide-methionine (S)-S-oxide reductase MsrA [Algoriphagus sp. NBT04N3]HAD49979.1 peptide-methionine (S)-S-oxide reductase [Algoriphagus sp.]HAS58191.1 peptide-methionine (S)-S-oxide reductase [Algoriphagus sp.]HAZ25231.1 peptide-methionine (S)-S-oxide reductase [Algoriphagus sp.]|tara:strand:+ start:13887 stop:14465 length:579 start_codon:yes stop_codon:yes gene_type:complete
MNELQLPKTTVSIPDGLSLITLGAGCFWCTEAVFQRLEGVEQVVSGYSGGFVENPTYREICSATTGHAEVIQVYFDPKKISLELILEVFWATHDPTTLNRQGADVGPQYRSAIFFHNEEQGRIASDLKAKLNQEQVFDNPIVTEVTAFTNFYKAENYHQDYYNQNGYQPYCQFVVKPKVDKLKKFFSDHLKS